MSPLFIGGLDANIESLFLPPVLWSAGFRQGSKKQKLEFNFFNPLSKYLAWFEFPFYFTGFVGCLRDLVINGRSVNVAEYAKGK